MEGKVDKNFYGCVVDNKIYSMDEQKPIFELDIKGQRHGEIIVAFFTEPMRHLISAGVKYGTHTVYILKLFFSWYYMDVN